ncbi:hypothetical protein BH10BAC6_BH10BAC6_04900 [soil metagenome]
MRVGTRSVGTLCFVMLLMSGDGSPHFMQIKEARESARALYAGKVPTRTAEDTSYAATDVCNPQMTLFLVGQKVVRPTLLCPTAS